MYLTDSMVGFEGESSKMVSLFPGTTMMTKSLEALNYTIADVVYNTILSTRGTTLKGHEFHFSKITNIPSDARFAYDMKIGKGIDGKHDGWLEYNVLASYMHMHFGYDAKIIRNFIKSCKKYRQK
jgi:cobyrinic acid a,c-diamide synthase